MSFVVKFRLESESYWSRGSNTPAVGPCWRVGVCSQIEWSRILTVAAPPVSRILSSILVHFTAPSILRKGEQIEAKTERTAVDVFCAGDFIHMRKVSHKRCEKRRVTTELRIRHFFLRDFFHESSHSRVQDDWRDGRCSFSTYES